ncbi:hypothetical protein ACJX0J_019695, partial [Zea mays]
MAMFAVYFCKIESKPLVHEWFSHAKKNKVLRTHIQLDQNAEGRIINFEDEDCTTVLQQMQMTITRGGTSSTLNTHKHHM